MDITIISSCVSFAFGTHKHDVQSPDRGGSLGDQTEADAPPPGMSSPVMQAGWVARDYMLRGTFWVDVISFLPIIPEVGVPVCAHRRRLPQTDGCEDVETLVAFCHVSVASAWSEYGRPYVTFNPCLAVGHGAASHDPAPVVGHTGFWGTAPAAPAAPRRSHQGA